MRPWLWVPSQMAHGLAPYTLPVIAKFYKKEDCSFRSFEWRGLSFRNPLGIAGGVDKSGRSLRAWQSLGAGFLEVGTITPERQGPNPGRIMDRDLNSFSLWNKMGFPNPGLNSVIKQLQKTTLQVPLFVNIGKNRWTENNKAHLDYSRCIEELHPFADVFVVNLSSPNTKGLRDLLKKENLQNFLQDTVETLEKLKLSQPVLLKLSPDMTEKDLTVALTHSAPLVDGWILTNTTKERFEGCPFPAHEGGLSGEPLKELSLKALRTAVPFKQSFPDKLLVSVGGVMTADDARIRLDLGADLVQCYSALVFEGPGFFHKALSELQ